MRFKRLGLLLILVLAGCGQNFTGGDTNPNPGSGSGGNTGGGGGGSTTPTLEVSLNPTGLNLQPGGQGTVNLTVNRNGFTGQVNLQASGSIVGSGPDKIQVGFNPNSIPSGQNGSTATVIVGNGVQPGSYQITLQASGQGANAGTATLTVNVGSGGGGGGGGGGSGSFALAVDPSSLTMVKVLGIYQPVKATVALSCSGGFAHPVQLSAQVTNAQGLLTADLNIAFSKTVLNCGETAQVTVRPSGLTLLYSRYIVQILGTGESQQASADLTVNILGL